MEALPPPPPAAIAEYHAEQTRPLDMHDPLVIEAVGNSAAAPPHIDIDPTAPSESLKPSQESVVDTIETTKAQRIKQKLGQVALGEGLGTAIDVATMAAGIPLPIREVAGSALDSKVYGSPLDKLADAERSPSRLRRIGVRVGSVAMVAVTGMVAQKFGSEAADMISDHFSDGVMGEYVTPLTTKFGGMLGMNAAIKKAVQ